MTTHEIRLGVVMDPIADIKPAKDSTLAMLLEAQRRGWHLRYMELGDLELRDGVARASARPLVVRDQEQDWYELGPTSTTALGDLDVLLMRKDPPFDAEYVYSTYILERAEEAGALVVNRPGALRDVSEKVHTAWFPELCPATLISRDKDALRRFVVEQGRAVLKPLDGMGGASVFVTGEGDLNLNVILETLTADGGRFTVAQAYLPAIADGDKRALLVDGEVVPYVLARVPAEGESRGNLAAGGRGEARAITDEDRALCEKIGPSLRERGLLFVGLDIIGDRLTEINVTSPTCIRELDRAFELNIAGLLLDAIEARLS